MLQATLSNPVVLQDSREITDGDLVSIYSQAAYVENPYDEDDGKKIVYVPITVETLLRNDANNEEKRESFRYARDLRLLQMGVQMDTPVNPVKWDGNIRDVDLYSRWLFQVVVILDCSRPINNGQLAKSFRLACDYYEKVRFP